MRLLKIIVAVLVCALIYQIAANQLFSRPSFALVDLSGSPDAANDSILQKTVLPVSIGGDTRRALRIAVSAPGQQLHYDLTLEGRGEFRLHNPDMSWVRFACGPPDLRGLRLCNGRVSSGPADGYIYAVADGPATIERLDIELLQERRIAATGMVPVSAALLFLTLLAPIFWIVRPGRAAPWAAGAGLLWIWYSAPLYALFAVLFLGTAYAMIVISGLRNSRWARPGIALGFALLALLAVKFLWPLVGSLTMWNPAAFLLPLGFSYFIIKIVDTIFKVTARQMEVPGPVEFFGFMLFPPTLAAGPIMTLPEFRKSGGTFSQLEQRTEGLMRIGGGLVKKLAADAILTLYLAPRIDTVLFAEHNTLIPFYMVAMTAYVYLEFSAYSDMVIGLGRWWGYRLPENFNFPLLRTNMRLFWKNWHMSLTQWITRHVFMPTSMELRRASPIAQMVLPILATMLAIGLWHGLQMVWVLWSVHHAMGILLGDAVLRWRAGSGSWTKSGLVALVGDRGAHRVNTALGIGFVWVWVSLGHCFTTTVSVRAALDNYVGVLTLGLV